MCSGGERGGGEGSREVKRWVGTYGVVWGREGWGGVEDGDEGEGRMRWV